MEAAAMQDDIDMLEVPPLVPEMALVQALPLVAFPAAQAAPALAAQQAAAAAEDLAPAPAAADAEPVNLLETVKPRHIYRRRPATETEKATWIIKPADASLQAAQPVEDQPSSAEEYAPVVQARICSESSTVDSKVLFINDSDVPVRALWIDFEGNEVAYSILEPKSKKKYRTFQSHAWIVRNVATGARMMLGDRLVIYGTSTKQTVHIRHIPVLPWNLSTHKHYPAGFQQEIRTLLTAHNRLANHPDLCTRPPTAPPRASLLPIKRKASPPLIGRLIAAHPPSASHSSGSHRPLLSPLRLADKFLTWCNVRISHDRANTTTGAPSSPMPTATTTTTTTPIATAARPAPADCSVLVSLASPKTAPQQHAPLSTNLGDLPSHLVMAIVQLAAPNTSQDISGPEIAHPDILPALLPGPPKPPTFHQPAGPVPAIGGGQMFLPQGGLQQQLLMHIQQQAQQHMQL